MEFIKRLKKSLDNYVGKEIRKEVLARYKEINGSTSPEIKAKFAKTVMERMENSIDKDICIKIREDCACKPQKALEQAKRLYEKHPKLDEFLIELQKIGIAGKRLELFNNKIYGLFGLGKCVCNMVKGAKEEIPILYCHCCKGHIKWLYEEVLEKSLEVELTETIISGGEECGYTVIIK
ncbi:hypothetical protein SAMN05446037_1003159 [Anaerovirgula multivorans]|uniref:L-2-amino-thiazoline-4-carboxylic acid hydrolase n=1 Tax=Anaerovirgula multivorans TaxID=312168 RepID=A0A239BE23_9FIRM|nr:DUF6144 family protein [Anaerovirgula multivorans]SNS05344.1 hypothetical protein SAMN05446037_1003159 [Anaerovirgula multivorans]